MPVLSDAMSAMCKIAQFLEKSSAYTGFSTESWKRLYGSAPTLSIWSVRLSPEPIRGAAGVERSWETMCGNCSERSKDMNRRTFHGEHFVILRQMLMEQLDAVP